MGYERITTLVELEMTTYDEETFTANFEDCLSESDTINNILGVSSIPAGLLFNGTTKDSTSKKIQTKISNGVDETRYIIHFNFNTVNGEKIRGEAILHVRDAKLPT